MSSEIVVGPGYLDALETIPEDGSVAAVNIQHAVPHSVTNLSTVSAVASSDSDREGDGFEVVDTTATNSIRRGKRPRHGATARISSGTGAAIGGDTFSDTHASLGGVTEQADRKPPSEEAPKQNYSGLTSCSRKTLSWRFSIFISVLLIVTAIGTYLIATKISDNMNSGEVDSAQSQPTQDPVFPPYYFESESFFPSVSPTYNQDDIVDINDALSRIIGVDSTAFYDAMTPEGKCRYWLTHDDQQQLRVGEVGESRIQQRYILCLLYHYTNGDYWTVNTWLQGNMHECDWQGVTCNATRVVGIELEDKNLTGTLPEALLSLSNLQLLRFMDNNISGRIPPTIFDNLRKLMWLDLSNNELTGAIPTGEENDSVNLKVMYLKGNALEGNLPFFPKLQRVLAQRNQLTSMDEKYATEGQSLVYLYVYSNQLSGQLPSSWNTPNLEIFDVGFNSLEGPIGQDLWDLPALKSLVVDNNRLTGTLPESSANTLLSTVWLDANQLEGSIPSNFGSNWSNLTSLKLQGNSLTGTITDDHCSNWPTSDSTSTEWELESDCNTDAVECSCCTMCFPERQRQNLRR